MRSLGQRIQTRNHADESTHGDNWETCEDRWETSVKLCKPEHSENPECGEREVGDKVKIMQAENPVYKCEIMRTNWETRGRQVETSGRQE